MSNLLSHGSDGSGRDGPDNGNRPETVTRDERLSTSVFHSFIIAATVLFII